MNLHLEVSVIQKAGCDALWKLASNTQNRKIIAAQGGTQAVRDALREHPDKIAVQKLGRAAMQVRSLAF